MQNSFIISSAKLSDLKNNRLIFSFLSIASGLIFGVVSYIFSSSLIESELYKLFVDFHLLFSDKTNLEIFSGFALSGLAYFFLMFVVGGSIFGKLLCSFITFIKAVGISLVTTYLYCDYGLKGFEYALLVFFPGKIILLFAMLFMTKTCIESSVLLTNVSEMNSVKIKNYCLKMIVVFIFLLISWMVDMLCIIIFSGLFSFS